ncbi:pilus assembly protein TadG-related protein [Virgibacillus xinjiangensis]|uniref:Pilus assembly protein TadG-related protein n=1 Tax=Virgibacillus xinjiangensis TaxID=393090 RepID=A0ABV7CYH3_9BACI
MKKLYRIVPKREDGSVIVLVAVAMAAMLMMVGLVIDGGNLYVSKSHLQKTANAAALSGAQEVVNDRAAVETVVDDILASHEEQASLSEPPIISETEIQVNLKKDVPLFFASLFGVESLPIQVEAKAGLNPIGEAKGAVPLGIHEQVELVYGDAYELKVDAGDSQNGHFGILALQGPGAKNYEETLKYGFDEALKVGDVVNTQTGNIAGPTRDGVNHRINNSPNDIEGYIPRDSDRIMLVLVYNTDGVSQGSVRITGFAYFYLEEQMGKNDDSIRGKFIEYAGSGMAGDSNPPDYGAYAIKLEE